MDTRTVVEYICFHCYKDKRFQSGNDNFIERYCYACIWRFARDYYKVDLSDAGLRHYFALDKGVVDENNL